MRPVSLLGTAALHVLLACGFCLSSSAALAQSNAQRDEAKQISAQGGKLMQQGKLDEAVDAFRRAYGIFANPRYQYNIGVALKNLGKDAEALTAFDVFLKDAQDVPPEFLADAKRQRDSLADHVAQFDIACTESGATLFIDNKAMGSTPLPAPVYVDVGQHSLRVEKAGFVPFAQTITLAARANPRVDVVLQAVVVAPVRPKPADSPARADLQTTATVLPTVEPAPERSNVGALRLDLTAGANMWLTGAPQGAGAAAMLGVSGGYRVWRRNELSFLLGADAYLTFMTEGDQRITFTSLLATPSLHYEVSPNRLSVFARAGMGLMIVSGVNAESSLLSPGATEVTGALSAWELRPTVGGEYSFSPTLAWYLTVGLAYSPRPDPQFQETSFVRLALATGASVRF